MNTYARLAVVAAGVLIVAVVASQFLSRQGGVGGPGPTVVASPSPSLLAHGAFVVYGITTNLDATGRGSNVTGTLTGRTVEADFTVDLQCERTVDGLLWIGGDVTQSTDLQNAPVGTRAAIVLQPGSPVRAVYVFQMTDPRAATCLTFFDDMQKYGPLPDQLDPITGTVQLAP